MREMRKKSKNNLKKKSITHYILIGGLILLSIVAAIGIGGVIAVKTSGMTMYTVKGSSMEPTIHDKSYVIVNKSKAVERFDVITFKLENSDDVVLKRVVGISGDEITVIDGHLFVNGNQYPEKYVNDKNKKEFMRQSFKLIVPKDTYFVLGDNRDESSDSRLLGPIEKKDVIGVVVTYWEGDK